VLQFQADGLSTFVIVPGVLYGQGECCHGLHAAFAKAWTGDDTGELMVHGHGNNHIPMVHVGDLARGIAALAVCDELDARYLLMSDDACLTQKECLQCISSAVGSGHLVSSSDESVFMTEVRRHL
jgi:nucleoside-diphosphate-sugar epimerase